VARGLARAHVGRNKEENKTNSNMTTYHISNLVTKINNILSLSNSHNSSPRVPSPASPFGQGARHPAGPHPAERGATRTPERGGRGAGPSVGGQNLGVRKIIVPNTKELVGILGVLKKEGFLNFEIKTSSPSRPLAPLGGVASPPRGGDATPSRRPRAQAGQGGGLQIRPESGRVRGELQVSLYCTK